MSWHLFACAAIDDQRLSTHTLGRTSDVDSGIAAAVNDNFTAEQRLFFAFHGAENGNSVKHVFCIAARDVGVFSHAGTDCEKDCIVTVSLLFFFDVFDGCVQFEFDAQIKDSCNFLIKHSAGKAVFRNTVAHHAAGLRAAFFDCDLMAFEGELIGSRKACRAGAYDQDFFACLLFGFDELVAVF